MAAAPEESQDRQMVKGGARIAAGRGGGETTLPGGVWALAAKSAALRLERWLCLGAGEFLVGLAAVGPQKDRIVYPNSVLA